MSDVYLSPPDPPNPDDEPEREPETNNERLDREEYERWFFGAGGFRRPTDSKTCRF